MVIFRNCPENTFKTEGIVLKRINFGEADRLITFYTKHFGKIVCLAKGVRRMSSRKRGSLEIFNQVRFFASKGRDLSIVAETEIINSFNFFRKNLKKVAIAYQLCEMVDKLTAEGHEQEDVYGLLVSYLSNLNNIGESNLNIYVDDFAVNLLKVLGFWPKDKPIPKNFNTSSFIENIIERELKSKNFARMVFV